MRTLLTIARKDFTVILRDKAAVLVMLVGVCVLAGAASAAFARRDLFT